MMKYIALAILICSAVSVPFSANAITAEELIRQKQARAFELQRGTPTRIHQLKQTGGNSPLQSGMNQPKYEDLEPASGDLESPEAAAPAVQPPIPAEPAETNAEPASGETDENAEQLRTPEPVYPPGGVI